MAKKGEKTIMSAVSDIVNLSQDSAIDALCRESIDLIRYSRHMASRQVDQIQLLAYFNIGRRIVEVEQAGKERAAYGKKVIASLSQALTEQFGKGFSVDTLENMRKFYLTYQNRISEPAVRKFIEPKSEPVVRKSEEFPFKLSWTHYLILMRIKDEQERSFYENEAICQNWGKRELSRQYASSLYERLLLSTDKEKVLEIAKAQRMPESISAWTLYFTIACSAALF